MVRQEGENQSIQFVNTDGKVSSAITEIKPGTIKIDGTLQFSGELSSDKPIHITDTTESTSVDTGSFTTKGGVGITKRLNVGGDTNIAGKISNDNTTDAIQLGVGAIVTRGGVSVAKQLRVGGATTLGDKLDVVVDV